MARKRPPRTPEEQEAYLVNLSFSQAERQLKEGRAPAQVVTHFLKLATEKARLELKQLEAETRLSEKKVDMIDQQTQSSADAREAIEALKSYRTSSSYYDDEVYFYDED